MKLRNLLFGTMIACAFAACSNEDEKYRIKKQLKNFAIPRRFSGNGKTINSYPADTVKE